MTRTISVSLPAGTLYVSGTVNGTAVTWTNTSGNTWEAVAARSTQDIYVVSLTIINSVGTSTTSDFTLYYGLHLIYDRTDADRQRVMLLARKGWDGMTEEEQDEWTAGMKGAYNASDANRVESAVQYIQTHLNALPGVLSDYLATQGVAPDAAFEVPYVYPIALTIKINWTAAEWMTTDDGTRYLGNVDDITDAITITKDLPASMDDLTIDGANEIERALQAEYDAALVWEVDTKTLIDNTAAAWHFCGEVYGGEIA